MHTVLLQHDLPDGTHHYDWMIQRPNVEKPSVAPPANTNSPGPRGLLTFRIHQRIDCGQAVHFIAEQLPDHRIAYLTYQGEIAGNRGTVTRLASGQVQITRLSDDELALDGTLGAATGTFHGRRRSDADHWDFTFQPHTP